MIDSPAAVHLPQSCRRTVPTAWARIVMYMATTATAIAQEMTFIEHLEELRRRMLWAIVSIAVIFAAAGLFLLTCTKSPALQFA